MKLVRIFVMAALAALALAPVAVADDPLPNCYPCDQR